MTSGASRYFLMRKIDRAAAKQTLPAILLGVLAGLFVFTYASRDLLRVIVGLVVGGIALHQLYHASIRRFGAAESTDLVELKRHQPRSFLAGGFSACTGTGVAEMHQPLFEHLGGLATKRANATAIFVEAVADWMITIFNLSMGNLRYDILIFSASGVLIGAQIGALLSPYLPDRLLKIIFSICVLGIGTVYVVTSTPRLLKGVG